VTAHKIGKPGDRCFVRRNWVVRTRTVPAVSARSAATDAAPYFDDLAIGEQIVDAAPLTLTEGHLAIHRALTGSQLILATSRPLSLAVTGRWLADPTAVWDAAIGQSTAMTRRVIGNLFYRGLAFHRLPAVGDTLESTTEVAALKQNSTPSGLAVLKVRTVDQEGRLILQFLRCAMLPLSRADVESAHDGNVNAVSVEPSPEPSEICAEWDRAAFPVSANGLAAGDRFEMEDPEVLGSPVEYARLSLNQAAAHVRAQDRLVYGGLTIGAASAFLGRSIPGLACIIGWESCDHLAPVRETDCLLVAAFVEAVETLEGGWSLAHLRAEVWKGSHSAPEPVLEWRVRGLLAT
jgi:acyl dehydratase